MNVPIRTWVLSLSMTAMIFSHAFANSSPAFTPVTGFSLDRYLGVWYEIARMPVSFEKDLDRVTATYTLRKDGKVEVLNQGYRNGKKKVAHGRAKFAGSPTVGHLRVSFFGPFFADYIILSLDENYTYAMVTSSSTKYLWILSRTPKLDQKILDSLLAKATELGFDTGKLIMVEQEK
jgi:apolipoprotein D and lipocalin family protein